MNVLIFLKKIEGEKYFLIFQFLIIPENAFKYELIFHLNNNENKNYISIISFTFKLIF